MKTMCGIPGCPHPAQESHHLYPLEFGGADDGPRYPLCGSHHTLVHENATKVEKGQLLREDLQPKEMRLLVKAILDQKAVFMATGDAPDARRRIVAHLTEQEQNDAHLIKSHYGFSSLEKMLKSIITNEALRIKRGNTRR